MPGVLTNLIAHGAQDVYLNVEKFRIYYKKHIIGDIVEKIEIIGWEFIEYVKITNGGIDIKNMFNNSYNQIDCSKLNIKKLPKFKNLYDFDKLKYLNCSHNKLNNLEKLKYINLIKLECSYNSMSIIPSKIKSLEYFDFSNNYVQDKIDLIGYPKLKYLLASSNKINQISNYPKQLIYLDLSNNPIVCVDNLPNSLEYLLVVQTRIKNINLTELSNLKYLDVSINKLYNIDGLPNGLVHLNCSQCELANLDNLPTSLEKLICINNKLKSLNMLPESIKYLDCEHNQITILDDLPNSLEELICSNNYLTILNNLPKKLKFIDYSNNLSCELTNKPKTLKTIIYKDNDKLLNSTKNNGPQNTFFKVNYKRYIDFAVDNIYNSLDDFGKQRTVKIDRNRELTNEPYVKTNTNTNNKNNLSKYEKKKLNKERKYMELSMRRFNRR